MIPGTVAAARPMRSDARRNQRAVLAAARAVLGELGEDATMEQIAARAGVGVGTVYRHFPNKSALYDELVRTIVSDLIGTATAALAVGDGSGLQSFLVMLGQSLADHNGYADTLMRHADGVRNQQLRDLIGQLVTQAVQYRIVRSDVTADDVVTAMAALRGVLAAPAPLSAGWRRHLLIFFQGMQVPLETSDPPALQTPARARPPSPGPHRTTGAEQ